MIADIAKEKGLRVHSMGDVVRDHFSRDCPGRDQIETGIFADMERKKHGNEIWARRLIYTLEKELKPDTDLVMIDGMRSSTEKEMFRNRWGADFTIMAVHSSPDTRFKRLAERMRKDDTTDRKRFDERDDRELGWGLGNIISKADIMLVNESGKETFEQEVCDLIEELEDER